ncbi:hypothetical protein [Nocardioides sp. KR10-350]|uniref:hypothetical protein n=1 Tax=Nocardioides cheoyonin TaxID=3156615 RepID=UPI0032B37F52
MSEETYAALERDRGRVIAWTRVLVEETDGTLARLDEPATGSYTGVDADGPSGESSAFRYEIQVRLRASAAEPLDAIAERLARFRPVVTQRTRTVTVSHGDLVADFDLAPRGGATVVLIVTGPETPITTDQMAAWDGWEVGVPVDLS